jgi:hypothetical protein
MNPASTIIARRILHDKDTEGQVEIIVHQPALDPDTTQGIWICRIELSGTSLAPVEARGVDSLQALIVGISAIRHTLKTLSKKLSWLGDSGETGLPLIIQDDDEDFIALVENVVEAEHRRAIIFRKALRRAKAPK